MAAALEGVVTFRAFCGRGLAKALFPGIALQPGRSAAPPRSPQPTAGVQTKAPSPLAPSQRTDPTLSRCGRVTSTSHEPRDRLSDDVTEGATLGRAPPRLVRGALKVALALGVAMETAPSAAARTRRRPTSVSPSSPFKRAPTMPFFSLF